MDIYHLTREIEASDMSSLEAVINCDEERLKLEKEAEALAAQVSHVDFGCSFFFSFFVLDVASVFHVGVVILIA